ncbi:interleukin-12 subunit alpha isoform X2 [Pseudoliparis swirei]|uniref:interleukin-12 subunit alpha isoform X2 n=1 Tax=Pseudoliparis swirei TaxID=2059687 RepID=UPI0024BE2B37|nr:interleukin-12 subunit alpha isoform X2 [Pseudoliparis swirei]
MRRARVDAYVALCAVGFASCVLLLTSSGRASAGLPVHARSAANSADCSLHCGNLLLTVRELLGSDVLCFGIASDGMMVMSQAETVLACAPTRTQNTSCTMERNSSFSESECLRNIRKDLAYYAAAFQSYSKSQLRSHNEEVALLSPTLEKIQRLKKSCSLTPNEEKDSSEEDAAQMWGDDTFSRRQKMCQMMRGFHVRTITINRAMGYISSGDHRK